MRNYTIFDRVAIEFDKALRTLSGVIETTDRENPSLNMAESGFTIEEKKHVAGLMRVNHVGEICAQALYHGQALTAKSDLVKLQMQQSASEENDHLVWCQQRLTELNSRASYLNPLWYGMSFAIGAFAGRMGDKWSLGFVVETENQVEKHLAHHLTSLPTADRKTRIILEQMQQDEMHHAELAKELGAVALPDWIKTIMRWQSKIMTTTAYWI